jgi:hypothetical protein
MVVKLVGIAERNVIVPPATGVVTAVMLDPWCVAEFAVLFTNDAHCEGAATVCPTATFATAV